MSDSFRSRGLTRARSTLVAASIAALGCGGSSSPPPVVIAPGAPHTSDDPFASRPDGWERKASKELRLSVPMPEASTWRVLADTAQRWMVTHEASSSVLAAYAFTQPEPVNSAACEELAKTRGYIPQVPLGTIEQSTGGPASWDGRFWVATQTKKEPWMGYVYYFGAQARRCLLVDFHTQAKDERTLALRLLAAREKIVGRLEILEPRTHEHIELPRTGPARR